jgi:DNA-binding response OmpR family regulator
MTTRNTPTSVLVIDDDPIVRHFVDLVLTQAGYGVTTEHTGELGIEALKRTRWDLVLLDIQLPGMNGFEVLHSLRQYLKSKARVTMMTSAADAGTVLRALKAGANGYLVKPFSSAVLKRRVNLAIMPIDPGGATESGAFGDLAVS